MIIGFPPERQCNNFLEKGTANDQNDDGKKHLLSKGESLTVEFKSDAKGLPDHDLMAAAVAMANTEGGLILLGVEDGGTVTGVQPTHQDAAGVAALIAIYKL